MATTDKKYNKTQAAAMKIVARWGVESYDALPNRNARNAVSHGWRIMLMSDCGIGNDGAVQHIARAIRRQRNPDWNGDCSQPVLHRGGVRAGAGVKKRS